MKFQCSGQLKSLNNVLGQSIFSMFLTFGPSSGILTHHSKGCSWVALRESIEWVTSACLCRVTWLEKLCDFVMPDLWVGVVEETQMKTDYEPNEWTK